MPYFLLGLALLVGGYLIYRGVKGANPARARMAIGVVIAIGAALVIVMIVASGRLGIMGWVALLLPVLMQWRNIRRGLGNMRGPTPGHSSDVETRFLRMRLEHDTGVLRGTVLDGTYRGRMLDELSLAELLDLLRECRIDDPPSAEVLESYLDRVHGGEWRADGPQSGNGGAGGNGRSRPGGGASDGAMTPQQAYEILGLKPGASDQEIREAHRRLLKTNHPDLGGSTWLAAQINLAKDLLLPDG